MRSFLVLGVLAGTFLIPSTPAHAAPPAGARVTFVRATDSADATWRIDLRRYAARSTRDLLFVSVTRSKADACGEGCTASPIEPAVVSLPAGAAQKYVDGEGGRPCVVVHAAWSKRGGGSVTKQDQWFKACVPERN